MCNPVTLNFKGVSLAICKDCQKLFHIYIDETEDCAVHGVGRFEQEFGEQEIKNQLNSGIKNILPNYKFHANKN
jgi:hypothetical protein